MLKVNNIDVYYGAIHAIKDVSLEVPDGEIVTLIGSNGAGKSTTLHTISGLIKPKNGSIIFEDKDISGMPAHRRHGLMPGTGRPPRVCQYDGNGKPGAWRLPAQ